MRIPILLAAVLSTLTLAPPAAAAPDLSPIKRVDPQYPADAARAGTEGFVEVEFTVDAGGKVTSVSVVNAKPARTFESSAVKAVKQWQFAPGGGRGKVRLDFAL